MSDRISELIGEIRGLSRGRIDPSQAEKIVDEVRAHLDASIQARIELGKPREEAESEAIVAFGDPRQFVESLRREPSVRKSLIDRATLLPLVALYAFGAVTLAGSQWSYDYSWAFWMGQDPTFTILCMAVSIVLGSWVFAVSWRAWRPQVLACAVTGLFCIPLFACALCGKSLVTSPLNISEGSMRQDVMNNLDQVDRQIAREKQAESVLSSARDTYVVHAPPGGPAVDIDYISEGDYVSLVTKPAVNRKLARRNWEYTISSMSKRHAESLREYLKTKESLQILLDRPLWLNAVYLIPTATQQSSIWGAFALFICLGSWFLRELMSALRRGKMPRPAA